MLASTIHAPLSEQAAFTIESPLWAFNLNLSLCRLLHDDQKESGLLPVLARLIKQFDRKFQGREHANELAQCLHVVLRMLERLGKEGESFREAFQRLLPAQAHCTHHQYWLSSSLTIRTAGFDNWAVTYFTNLPADFAEAGGFLVQRRIRVVQSRKSQKAAPSSSPGGTPASPAQPEDVHPSRASQDNAGNGGNVSPSGVLRPSLQA